MDIYRDKSELAKREVHTIEHKLFDINCKDLNDEFEVNIDNDRLQASYSSVDTNEMLPSTKMNNES